jgi:hypothetical protein
MVDRKKKRCAHHPPCRAGRKPTNSQIAPRPSWENPSGLAFNQSATLAAIQTNVTSLRHGSVLLSHHLRPCYGAKRMKNDESMKIFSKKLNGHCHAKNV